MTNDPSRLMRFVLEMRQAGVTDARTLSAMERTARAHYAPAHLAALALDDGALPLAHGQVMTKPSTVGRVVAALDVQRDHNVLEIGTGSGFQAGVLGDLARRVVTLERWRDLLAEARARLGRARLMNAMAHVADGALGWLEDAPYDRIVFNCAVEEPPDIVFDQLKPGGVLIAPLANRDGQRLIRFRNGQREDLGPSDFAALEPGVAQP